MTRRQERAARLLPAGVPKYARCYDNGDESCDRYTVVFSGRYASRYRGWTDYRAMSASPFHPQGVGLWCQVEGGCDRPRSSHLGKRIAFAKLPDDCRKLVLRDYNEIWGLT